MMAEFLGIDTSCYTTSAALCDEKGLLLQEERIILSVKEGKRGLAQSEMVYQHVRNLPVLFRRLGETRLHHIRGIGVSAWPRRRADSYMPAFLAGKGTAEALAATLHVPLFYFSHQENHAMAALREAPSFWGKPFYMMHLSGGTHDVLSVTWEEGHMAIEELLSSADITAGQFIDRTGVALGLSFPAGAALEKLAAKGTGAYEAPVSRFTDRFSFAGPETQVERAIQSGDFPPEEIARGVLTAIGRALVRVLGKLPLDSSRPFIAVGGVMANRYLRQVVKDIFQKKGMAVIFADPHYSSDNATGNAFGASVLFS